MTMSAMHVIVLVCAALASVKGQVSPYTYKEVVSTYNAARNQVLRSFDDSICMTGVCVDTGGRIRKDMNTSVNPCDNMYEFACGSFMDNTTVSESRPKVTKFHYMQNAINEQLTKLIIEQSDTSNKAFLSVKTFYESCMNPDKSKILNNRILGELMNAMISFTTDGKKFELSPRIEKYVYHFWYDVYYLYEPMTDKIQIYIARPKSEPLKMVPDEGNQTEELKKLAQVFSRNAQLFGINASEEQFDMTRFHQSGMKIRNMRRTLPDLTDSNTFQSIDDFETKFPFINWTSWIDQELLDKMKEKDTIQLIFDSPYFTKLNELLGELSNKHVLNDFVLLESYFKLIDMNFKANAAKSSKEKNTLSKYCVERVLEYFPLAVSAMYVKKNLVIFNETKVNVEDMLRNIKEQYVDKLGKSEWLDPKSKANALEKILSMSRHVVYPDKLLNSKFLESYYETLNITGKGFLDLDVEMVLFQDTVVNALSRNVELKVYSETTITGATNFQNRNTINIAAGITQGIFFNKDRPQYLNYGYLGAIIGHEMGHCFDNDGINLDKRGQKNRWMSPTTEEEFQERVDCVNDQYKGFCEKDVHLCVNANQTSSENIADIMGTRIAYYAYLEWAKNNEEEQKLLFMYDYTPNQMFWISFANMYCSKSRLKELKHQFKTDVHSPEKFRVLGTLQNIPEFAKDFNCPHKSYMNPKKKMYFL